MPDEPFKIGDRVVKVGGDYTFNGIIVASFTKRSGARRYVVENDAGILHIFSEKNLGVPASFVRRDQQQERP